MLSPCLQNSHIWLFLSVDYFPVCLPHTFVIYYDVIYYFCLLFTEQGGVMVQPDLSILHDRLLCDDPGLLRGVYLHDEARGPTLRPLRFLLPVLQRLISGQLLDPPTDGPAADHEDRRPAIQHRTCALWGSAGQRRLLHHV